MAGRFEGLSDVEWESLKELFPEETKKHKGMPHAPFRTVINTIVYVFKPSAVGVMYQWGQRGPQKVPLTVG
jgi:hypothetical protein